MTGRSDRERWDSPRSTIVSVILADVVTVAGVDGYRGGWVAVVLGDGETEDVFTCSTLDQLLETLPHLSVLAVDVPIGLPADGRRKADLEAQKFVGPRQSSVFLMPPRAVLETDTFQDAQRVARRRFGFGVTTQAYRGLRKRIFEAEAAVKEGAPLIEAHPEVSFRALAGRPLQHSKKTWNGQMLRLRLLQDAGIHLPDSLVNAGDAPPDDVLDAAAAAWTAHRKAMGQANSLPDPPEIDDHGIPMAIWY